MLFELDFSSVAVVWLVCAALMVDGWLLVVSWLGNVVLFKLEFRLVDVVWQLRLAWLVVGMLLFLVVDDGLFKLALWGSVLVDGRVFDGVGWCMFSGELCCVSCWHAGMVHRGGSINSYGIACSIAIPPLAVGSGCNLGFHGTAYSKRRHS